MIDSDIRTLNEQQPARSLNGLEADVWTGVAARMQSRRAGRMIVSCQAALLATALIGSTVAGAFTAASADNPLQELSSFSSNTELAPSTLLLGRGR